MWARAAISLEMPLSAWKGSGEEEHAGARLRARIFVPLASSTREVVSPPFLMQSRQHSSFRGWQGSSSRDAALFSELWQTAMTPMMLCSC